MATYIIGPSQPVGRRTLADATNMGGTGQAVAGDVIAFEPGTYSGFLTASEGIVYTCLVPGQYWTLTSGSIGAAKNCVLDHFKVDGASAVASNGVTPVGASDGLGCKNVTLSNYEIKNCTSYAIANNHGQWTKHISASNEDDSGWLMVNGHHSNNGTAFQWDTQLYGSNCTFRSITWDNVPGASILITGRGCRVEDTCVFHGGRGVIVGCGDVVVSGQFFGCFNVASFQSQDGSGLGGTISFVNIVADGQGVMNHLIDFNKGVQPDSSALAPVRFLVANMTAYNPDPVDGTGLLFADITQNGHRFVRVRDCAFGAGFQDNGIEAAYDRITWGSVDYCFFERTNPAINTDKEGVHSFKAGDMRFDETALAPFGDSPLIRAGTSNVPYSDQVNFLEVTPRVPDVGWLGVEAPPAPPLPLDLTPPRSWSFWLATCTVDVNIEDQLIGQFTQATDRTLTLGLNSPGSASFTVDMSDPLVSQMEEIRTCLVAICDGIVQWSGPIWTLNEQLPERKIAVTAVGWLELLNHRLVRPKKDASNNVTVGQPAGVGSTADYIPFNDPTANVTGWTLSDPFVVRILLDITNGKNEYTGHEFSWDTGIRWFDVTQDTGVDFNEPYSTPYFYGSTDAAISHTWRINRFQNVGQQIMQIVNLEGGLDIWIDPNTRRLHYQTRTNDDLSAIYNNYTLSLAIEHKPAQTFAYGVGPHNLANLRRTTDPSWMTNWFTAVGKYNDFFVSDPDSVTHFGQVFDTEESISVSPATSDQEQSTLPLYAGAEVAIRSFPRVIYELTPMGTRSFSTPRLTEIALYDGDTFHGFAGDPFEGGELVYQGGDMRIGDWASLQARAGTVVIDQLVRVYGATINIDDVGVEKLASIQTSYQASS